jgi:hypothetical protein
LEVNFFDQLLALLRQFRDKGTEKAGSAVFHDDIETAIMCVL